MKRPLLRIAGTAMVLALAVAVLHQVVYERFRTAVGLREAIVLSSRAADRQTPDSVRVYAAQDALRMLYAIRNGSPDDQRVAMLTGSNEHALRRHGDAAASFREALRWGQRPEIYIALAEAQASAGQRAEAVENMYKALLFDPSSLLNTDYADLRAEAIRRFEEKATPAQRGEMYLNMALASFENGFMKEGVELAAAGAMHDGRILNRAELRGWGDMWKFAQQRYAELQREQQLQPR